MARKYTTKKNPPCLKTRYRTTITKEEVKDVDPLQNFFQIQNRTRERRLKTKEQKSKICRYRRPPRAMPQNRPARKGRMQP